MDPTPGSRLDRRARLHALRAEHRRLANRLEGLSPDQWRRPSAAAGWSVRDQVAHLADTDEVAADTVLGGPRCFRLAVAGFRTAEDFTEAGCRRADDLSHPELLVWWRRAAHRTEQVLDAVAADDRVAWGLGMSAETFVVARLMEHWAHGLDITDALAGDAAGTRPRAAADPDSGHGPALIAELGRVTLPYALARARIRRPVGRGLRLELIDETGRDVVLGPPRGESVDVVRGSLTAWCRVATRRADRVVTDGGPPWRLRLETEGSLAELAADHACAYL